MKKFDNFLNVLNQLKTADQEKCKYDMIYRSGVIAHFNLTFELAWKLLQSILREYSSRQKHISLYL